MGSILKFLLTIFALGTESEAERRQREWKEAARENRVGTKFFGDLLAGAFGAILIALFIDSHVESTR